MRVYRFYFWTIVMIILVFGISTITVNAENNKRSQHKDEYYEEMEEQYIVELRKKLLEKGYRNAGITMTKVFYENGNREYTVKLYHKRMCKLEGAQQVLLLDELSKIEFADSECRVYLKFL